MARLAELAAAGPGKSHPFVKLVSAPELVEAAVRAGQPCVAQAALLEFERFARDAAPPWVLALVARCRGLLVRRRRCGAPLPRLPPPPRRECPPVRPGAHGARVRRVPAPRRASQAGAGASPRRPRCIRAPGRGRLGRARPRRAARERRDGSQTRSDRDRPAARRRSSRSHGSSPKGATNKEVAVAVVLEPAHDRLPPAQDLHQARHLFGRRAHAQRRRGRRPALSSRPAPDVKDWRPRPRGWARVVADDCPADLIRRLIAAQRGRRSAAPCQIAPTPG